MKKREGSDIWNGLYDFYLAETNRNQRAEKTVEAEPFLRKISRQIEVKPDTHRIKHVLSHQNIYARFVWMTIPKNSRYELPKSLKLRFYSIKQIMDLPKPVLISRFLKEKGILE